MKRKITDEEVGQAIGKLAEEVRSQLDYEYRVSYSQMNIAENDLVDTLDEKQKVLYNDFCAKREAFYDVAREIYKRKF